MSFWKLYTSLFLLSTTIGFATEKSIAVCGYSPEYEDLYYPIIDQRIVGDPSLFPFLNCPMSTFCEYPGTRTAVQENLDDWRKFFGTNLSEETLYQLIYTKEVDWYRKLATDDSSVSNGELVKKINYNLQKSFGRYMLLAKQCEGIRSNHSSGRGWYQGEYDDTNDQKPELLELALGNYKAETNSFLKNRYGYQIVRLAHYLQENEAALRYFESFLKLEPETPFIYYLALEQRSGAAYNLGHLQEATKGFLEVYTKAPSRRESCALSLKYMDWANPQLNDGFFIENGYAEIESFFKSYYLNGSISREMQKLQYKNPNSPYLEVLAIREVDKLQNRIFNNQYYSWSGYSDSEEIVDSETLKTLQDIAISQIKNENVSRKDFWKIVLSATYLKNSDYTNAEFYTSEISENSKMYVQSKRLSFAIAILRLKSVERDEIGMLFSELKSDKQLYGSRPLTAFFFNAVSDLYKKEGNAIVSLLTSLNYGMDLTEYSWQDIELSIGDHSNLRYKNEFVKDEIIQNLQAFINLPDKTDYERLIMSKLKSNPQDYANELRGTYYFQQNNLDEAISYFKNIGNPSAFYGKYIRPEMFSGAIREYFDTPFSEQSDKINLRYQSLFAEDSQYAEQGETYPDNKLKLAQTFQKLEALVKIDPANASDYYYMLGNAWYNISERGWFLNSLNYVGNNNRNYVLNYDYYADGERNGKDSEFAKTATKYFQKALTAKGTRETKAKATFMLAKTNYCFTQERTSNYKYKVKVCGDHKGYFEDLKRDYSDTDFEALIIKECSWYRSFLANQ